MRKEQKIDLVRKASKIIKDKGLRRAFAERYNKVHKTSLCTGLNRFERVLSGEEKKEERYLEFYDLIFKKKI